MSGDRTRPLAFDLPAAALVALTLLAACRPAGDSAAETSPQPPALPAPASILFISLDTLRADLLGVYGYDEYPTSPFLDRFAEESVVFDTAIVQEPRTLTSHMSLFTGLYPQHHGVRDDTVLAPEIPTLAALLKQCGWRTQAFVDDGYLDRRWGFDRGFDDYTGDRRRGFAEILPEATDWLRGQTAQHGGERFFLFLHTYDVHSVGDFPFYRAPKPFRDTFSAAVDSSLRSVGKTEFDSKWLARSGPVSDSDRRFIQATYAEAVRYVDESLAELFTTLRESPDFENWLIVIWSDHGEGLFSHQTFLHDELYDHTIHVPLIVRLPGGRYAGKRVAAPISAIDLAPTILELADCPAPLPMDGRSRLDLLTHDDGQGIAFSRRIKNGQRLFSVRDRRFHYIRDDRAGQEYFYDLASDPGEHHNLSPSGTAQEAALRRQLRAWVAEHDQAILHQGGDEAVIDDETAARLRALGYLR